MLKKRYLRLCEMSFGWNNENARKERGSPKEKNTLMRGIGEAREDSERMEGWVSGRGNKRGSKSRPGPGLANKRAPVDSPRGCSSKL